MCSQLHGEFTATVNGYRPSLRRGRPAACESSAFIAPANAGQLPTAVDWRPEGAVTPVKDQGACGSCWAFSATGSLEGQHFRKTGKLVSLSEQNLVDCSTAFGNNGCNGGLMDWAFKYIKANGGIDTEASYPYDAENEQCHFKKADVGAGDTGFVDIPAGDEVAMAKAVAAVGPVSVGIDAGHKSFQFYSHGVLLRAGLRPGDPRPRRPRRRLRRGGRQELLAGQELVGHHLGRPRLHQDDQGREQPVRHRLRRLLPPRLDDQRLKR